MPQSKPRNRKAKALPRFRSEDAERAFWAKHDVADYFDWGRAVVATFPNLKPSTTTISIRLPELAGEMPAAEAHFVRRHDMNALEPPITAV